VSSLLLVKFVGIAFKLVNAWLPLRVHFLCLFWNQNLTNLINFQYTTSLVLKTEKVRIILWWKWPF